MTSRIQKRQDDLNRLSRQQLLAKHLRSMPKRASTQLDAARQMVSDFSKSELVEEILMHEFGFNIASEFFGAVANDFKSFHRM